MPEPSWTVVMPVKRLGEAKSRLRGALPGVPHEELALALAADTLHAARACPAVGRVLVVTDDPRVTAAATAAGAGVVTDPGGGLNAAFRHGAAVAGPRAAVAGVTADLPALRPAELAAALRTTEGVRGFVADAPGGGTVLLAAPAGVPLAPRFGPGSAGAHAASGALPLVGDWPSLRRDVDIAADLAAAAGLGVGPRTGALLAAAGDPLRYGAGMQGTVATYDASTRSGVLLLDDGTELAFPARAFDASGLRLLRLGQRVRVERDTAGEVVRVALVTMA